METSHTQRLGGTLVSNVEPRGVVPGDPIIKSPEVRQKQGHGAFLPGPKLEVG